MKRTDRSRVGLWIALVTTGVLAVAGCGGGSEQPPPPPPPTTQTNCPPEDMSAKKVTIAANLSVVPGRLDLSRAQKDKFQWHNASPEDVQVVFKKPGGELLFARLLIPANSFSQVYYVCETCTYGLYEYRIYHLVSGTWQEATPGGAPTVPEVSVGP